MHLVRSAPPPRPTVPELAGLNDVARKDGIASGRFLREVAEHVRSVNGDASKRPPSDQTMACWADREARVTGCSFPRLRI